MYIGRKKDDANTHFPFHSFPLLGTNNKIIKLKHEHYPIENKKNQMYIMF